VALTCSKPGNVCGAQFLPQDVVKKFPEMKPTEMLQKTQEALMDSRLSRMHQELIKRSDEGRQGGENYETTQRELERLRAKKVRAQPQVPQVRAQPKGERPIRGGATAPVLSNSRGGGANSCAQELAKKEVDKYQEWQRVNEEVEKMKQCEPLLTSGLTLDSCDSETLACACACSLLRCISS
jgi:hypothetical protein